MTRRKKIVWGTLAALVLLLAAAWHYRIVFLQYSLGWYADIVHPRGPYKPIAWMTPPAGAKADGVRPPNVVVILADDLGFNDVTSYGGGHAGVPTPNIDALAAQGARFDQGYAGSAVCTVSRAALLTGRYPWRFGVEFTPVPGSMGRVTAALYGDIKERPPVMVDLDIASGVKDFDQLGMPASETTIAEVLRQRGYHNVHIGKWHLGSTAEMRPNNQGFDESVFMESGLYLREDDPRSVAAKLDFDPIDRFLWPNMRFGVSYNGGKWYEPPKYLTDYFTDEAVNVIKTNKDRPFFLYLAHWGVHSPLQADKADYDALAHIPDHRQRVYGAMIRSIDRSVGRVMQALKDNGLDDNTIVIFTSDNGAPGYIGIPDVNKPYRGWKLSFFEGGLHVPFMARWPGKIPAGQRYNGTVSHIDILPTVAAAAGAPLPADRKTDGVNLLPYLAPDAPPQPGRPLFFRDGPYRAVIDQGWKLIVAAREDKRWLFDLNKDPTEKNNLLRQHPDQAARLKALMDQHHANMPKPLWDSFLAVPIHIDKTLEQKVGPNDEYAYWLN